MKLYLDDNIAWTVLVSLLRRAGHEVQVPADVGMRGKRDPQHLAHAAKEGRTTLSLNYRDFEPLHELIMVTCGPTTHSRPFSDNAS
jgi:hypothetical protein